MDQFLDEFFRYAIIAQQYGTVFCISTSNLNQPIIADFCRVKRYIKHILIAINVHGEYLTCRMVIYIKGLCGLHG